MPVGVVAAAAASNVAALSVDFAGFVEIVGFGPLMHRSQHPSHLCRQS